MSNTFNINRFGLLLKRQWQELGKIYLISLLVVVGILCTFYGFCIPTLKDFNTRDGGLILNMSFREPLFLVTGFLFISVVSSNYFAHLGQKPRAMIELMLPCSLIEKFLAGIFFTGILATLSYVFIYFVVDSSFVGYVQKVFNAGIADGNGHNVVYTAKSFFAIYTGIFTYPFYVLPTAISSLFLLGSIYFNRFHYIKTTISVMIFSGILSYVTYQVSRLLKDGKVRIMDDEPTHITQEQVMYLLIGVLVLITLILWFIGFVRLKEKEV